MTWDNFESRVAALYEQYPLTPWPLMEVMWLRSECLRSLHHDHRSQSFNVLEKIEEEYGVRLSSLTDATNFLTEQVALERQRARDRAAKMRETETV